MCLMLCAVHLPRNFTHGTDVGDRCTGFSFEWLYVGETATSP